MSTPTTQQTAAHEFVAFWTGKGYEKGQTQPFYAARSPVISFSRSRIVLNWSMRSSQSVGRS